MKILSLCGLLGYGYDEKQRSTTSMTIDKIDTALKKGGYNPKAIIENNEELRKVVGTLIDGTFDDGGAKGPGSFGELYDALTKGTHWHDPDHYFLMRDLPEYIETKIRANADYANRREFGRKCLKNVANAGKFSSDRAILEYADEIWHVSHK